MSRERMQLIMVKIENHAEKMSIFRRADDLPIVVLYDRIWLSKVVHRR